LQGFAIGSAALVSLALFGAFVSRAAISTVDVLTPKVFIGLIVGAMLPYWFSAMTMKSVGSAALKMVEEVRRQFNTIPGLMEGTTKPDYATCVKISTDASIKEMIPPGALVMLTPLIVGILFGVETLSGVLAGALVSGVQVDGSSSQVSNFGKIVASEFFLIPFHLFRLPSLRPTPVVPGTMPRSTLR
jgi:inorganic pyrophosphatase